MGVRWATLLSLAFCGIDFAIVRLFASEQADDEPAKVWYLFGAWILAAAVNATLSWWAFSLALATYHVENAVSALLAAGVWVIRILIIAPLEKEVE